jgi:ATP-dependent RNA helicase DDX18/HAS1
LLKKNYFLHQSAKDGYRSYLQAYASYSLKKIFDINALDLAKVGKAFGFSVPPRVNVNVGGGKSTAGKNGRKRPQEENSDDGGGDDETDTEEARKPTEVRRKGKRRRIETLGLKKVDKEVYRKEKDRQKLVAGGQWSR